MRPSTLLEHALRAYEAIEDQEGELRALSALLEVRYVGREMVDEAVARAQAILARVEPREVRMRPRSRQRSPRGWPRSTMVSRWLYFTSGRYDEQLSAARRAAELARAAGDETQLVWALHRLYVAEAALGHDGSRRSRRPPGDGGADRSDHDRRHRRTT